MDSPDSFHPYCAIQSIAVKRVSYGWYQENLVNGVENEKLKDVIGELIVYKRQGYPINNSSKHLEWMKIYFQNARASFRSTEIDKHSTYCKYLFYSIVLFITRKE